MARIWALCIMVLVICSCSAPPPAPIVQRNVVFRKTDAQIWTNAAFQPSRLVGEWRQIGGFQHPDAPRCGVENLRITRAAAGPQVEGNLCLNGQRRAISGPLQAIGPGRLQVAGQMQWWVIWVDYDYRTLAIGSPDGRYGFVLERQSFAADRWRAAREIFDFNGYFTAHLQKF